MHQCTKCHYFLGVAAFDKNKSNGPVNRCITCRRKANRDACKKDAAGRNRRGREYHHKWRKAAIEEYGGKCVCCAESRVEFLAFDHIKGGGREHRRQLKGKQIHVWLREQGYPKDTFRILCHNCNMAKGFYGVCPHEKDLQIKD